MMPDRSRQSRSSRMVIPERTWSGRRPRLGPIERWHHYLFAGQSPGRCTTDFRPELEARDVDRRRPVGAGQEPGALADACQFGDVIDSAGLRSAMPRPR